MLNQPLGRVDGQFQLPHPLHAGGSSDPDLVEVQLYLPLHIDEAALDDLVGGTTAEAAQSEINRRNDFLIHTPSAAAHLDLVNPTPVKERPTHLSMQILAGILPSHSVDLDSGS